MITEDDVNRLFRDMFAARRAIAERQEDLAAAEARSKQAQADLDDAKQALDTIENRIQGLVDRAAGIRPRIVDDVPAPRSEYRPIRR